MKRGISRILSVGVLLGTAAVDCGAVAPAGGLLFANAPLSVAEQGSGGLYGGYDVFKAFVNPAVMAWQPSSFSLGTADQVMFGGGQNLWAVAGSWAEQYTDGGSYGIAALASGMSAQAFKELDLLGNPTGTVVAPFGLHLASGFFYQWRGFSTGLGVHLGSVSYGGQLPDQLTTGMSFFGVDLGVMQKLGRLEAGAVFSQRDKQATGIDMVRLGGAIHTTGWFPGMVSVEFASPLINGDGKPSNSRQAAAQTVTSVPPQFSGGVTWDGLRLLTVRAGYATPGEGGSLRAGFTLPYRGLALDYAFAMPLGAVSALGAGHLVAVRWDLGGNRVQYVKREARPLTFASTEKDRTMGVANLDPQNVSASDAAIIADLLRNELVREGTFNIVEKANMDKILGEQAFQQTGCTSQECAVKLGRVLNVRFLVVGGFGRILDQFVVSMRVVDVESGRIIYSDTTQGHDLGEVQAGVRALAMRLTDAVKKEK